MRRWLRRRRVWLMHGPAALGGPSRAWLWLGLTAVIALAWAVREINLANDDVAVTQAAYEDLLQDQAEQQVLLQALREDKQLLSEALNKAQATAAQAVATNSSVSSQTLVDLATHEELLRQLRSAQQENARLKQQLAFFQSTIPKGGLKSGVALRRFEARRIAPTQVHWQALVVQPVKNAETWTGQLSLDISGSLDGQAWHMSPPSGPVDVSLVQFVRLQGVVDIPAEVELTSISAKLLKGKRLVVVQTYKF